MYLMGCTKDAIKENWGHADLKQTEDYLREILKYEAEQKVPAPKMKKKKDLQLLGKRSKKEEEKGAKKTAKAQILQETGEPLKKRLRKRQGTEP